MGRSWARVASALILGLPFAGVALAACSSFSPAATDDGGADGAAGGNDDAASGDDAQRDEDASAGDASEASGGPVTLLEESFEADDSCDSWSKRHGATFNHVDGGNNGSAGACRLCVQSMDGSSIPFVEKIVMNPPSGHYLVAGYFRAPPDTTPASTDNNFVGLQFDVAAPQAISEASPVTVGNTWVRSATPFVSPAGAVAVHATIEIGGIIGTCYDVDDVTLTVSP